MKIKGFKISRRRAIIYFTYAVMLMLTLVLNDTFSDFTHSHEADVANIKVADMNYNLVINGAQTTTLYVPANDETIANIIINSLNTVDSYYEVIYGICPTEECTSLIETPPNFYVEYSSRTTDPITEVIKADEYKQVRLGITNNTSTGYYLKFGINAGYIHNTLALKNQIINEYNEEDVTIAAIIDGEISTTFPTTSNYVANVTCTTNGGSSNATGTATWNGTKWLVDITGADSGKTVCNVYFKTTLNNHIISLADNSSETGVYNENGYRYQGLDPNNYVSFNNETWRIIGVFDDYTHGIAGENLVKIIRADSIGDYAWDSNNINDWNTSSLKAYLNGDYYNSLNPVSQSLIENVTWKLGGYADYNTTTSSLAYTAERGTTVYSGRDTTGTGYIGLMYPSDYGYAVLNTSCSRDTTTLYDYDNDGCYNQNWLYLGSYEWTITPRSSSSNHVWNVLYNGHVRNRYAGYGFVGRPSLYLKSNTTIISGDGTAETPFELGE
ncbi:MAG: hypothetical protein PHG03_02920 [Bacilli bacterium]|nr:hypothetical protein [Bacilli bacterium]